MATAQQGAPKSPVVVAEGPSFEVAVSGEYFYFNRSSDFLGVGESAKAASKLKGGLAGAGVRISPLSSDNKNSFEINYRAGSLEGTPKYVLSPTFSLTSEIKDTRKELEIGGLYYLGKFIKSLRYGYFRMEESLENVLPSSSPATWDSKTGGLDPSNPKKYSRSMTNNSAYFGISSGWATSPSQGKNDAIYGLKLDADLQAGELQSNFLSLSAKQSKSAFFGLPHRATLYTRTFIGQTSTVFGEAGYRGVYNFSSSGGVKGYDSGLFARAGFSWSF